MDGWLIMSACWSCWPWQHFYHHRLILWNESRAKERCTHACNQSWEDSIPSQRLNENHYDAVWRITIKCAKPLLYIYYDIRQLYYSEIKASYVNSAYLPHLDICKQVWRYTRLTSLELFLKCQHEEMHVCLCVLTTVVEEAHVRQDEPPLLPQLHACTVLNESKVISETKYNNYRERYYFQTHVLISCFLFKSELALLQPFLLNSLHHLLFVISS